MLKTTHLMLGQMDAQGKPDDESPERIVPYGSSCAVKLHECINHTQTEGLQPLTSRFVADVPENLLLNEG